MCQLTRNYLKGMNVNIVEIITIYNFFLFYRFYETSRIFDEDFK